MVTHDPWAAGPIGFRLTAGTAGRGVFLHNCTHRDRCPRRAGVGTVADEETAMGTDDDGLRAIVTEVTSAHGYDLEELTARAVGRRRVVRVVIDSDDGVDLDDAAQVSREISERLDGPDDPMGEVTGHLLRADDHGIELLVTGKKGAVESVAVAYDQITAAKVEVEFAAVPAAVQELLDAEGVTR